MAPLTKFTAAQALRDRWTRLHVRNGAITDPSGAVTDLSGAVTDLSGAAATVQNVESSEEKGKDEPKLDRPFAVFVGGNNLFEVDESVLKRSPVFAKMCNGSFAESTTKVIVLPEDDGATFQFFLEYLASSHNALPGNMKVGGHYPEKLSKLYILANKYQVVALEEAIVTALEVYYLDHEIISRRTAMRLFSIGEMVYGNVSGVNDPFKMWFRPMIVVALKDASNEMMEEVYEMVGHGGDFGVDTCRAIAEAWIASREMVREVKKAIGALSIYD